MPAASARAPGGAIGLGVFGEAPKKLTYKNAHQGFMYPYVIQYIYIDVYSIFEAYTLLWFYGNDTKVSNDVFFCVAVLICVNIVVNIGITHAFVLHQHVQTKATCAAHSPGACTENCAAEKPTESLSVWSCTSWGQMLKADAFLVWVAS